MEPELSNLSTGVPSRAHQGPHDDEACWSLLWVLKWQNFLTSIWCLCLKKPALSAAANILVAVTVRQNNTDDTNDSWISGLSHYWFVLRCTQEDGMMHSQSTATSYLSAFFIMTIFSSFSNNFVVQYYTKGSWEDVKRDTEQLWLLP